ncbi:hypothetical protein CA13_02130 [Planctomycetes bacterium CA13]|uniref:Mannosylglycerate hydrolase n=2 Tax=Novipirellula herctigrandis TaxID=2527986 RepID=A0A5C5YVL9_9BACT|nr:hypothetical protein CA13_02130 [Planctomycetes bacterium CA13]
MLSTFPKHTLNVLIMLACASAWSAADEPKTAYFVDGYHGGVYGHYPPGYTGFLVDQLKANPNWKINLEIEPETWDVAKVYEPKAYEAFKKMMEDQSEAGQIEVVNPSYAQSYFFQSSGESAIRQFDYGIRKMRDHFPGVRYTTYSSEEPCFTSCLPPLLKSFGFDFAVLKNPDTCWGGYTSAYGGELVNWIGPDGTSILTVPRYACEELQSDSSWQTTAFENSPKYIDACLKAGIANPVGMCLQDAGWRNGPWLGSGRKGEVTSHYVKWRDYIRNITQAKTDDDWHFSQEDVKPGLMWGAQVLQRIAQQSRRAEQRLIVAEKMAAMNFIDQRRPPMTAAIDEAWHNVLLSQHHDCWIVPYNGRLGNTWADQVRRWTNLSNAVSNLSISRSLESLLDTDGKRSGRFVRLFNPTAESIDAVVPVPIQKNDKRSRFVSLADDGRRFSTQVIASGSPSQNALLIRGKVPPMGYTTVELRDDVKATENAVTTRASDDAVVIESDLYRIEFDLAHGGTIRSLVAKTLADREFVDTKNKHRFNELSGYFFEQGEFQSSADQPAQVRIIEDGPLRAVVEFSGTIADNPFVQRVSVTQGSPTIDCSVRIDWLGNPRIGEFEDKNGYKNRRRAAYDDRFKLLTLFPVNLNNQKVAKNAAFDVCESKLTDTFYNSWEDIKHNVILDWVDVADGSGDYGLAMLSDHTTSYTHGPNFPLGLTIQYAGKGLWGRDYRVEGPTEVRYALMPHAGHWDKARVPAVAASWQQPVIGEMSRGAAKRVRSLIDPGDSGWEVPAMFVREGTLIVRLFNASGDDSPQDLKIGFHAEKIELVELDGRVIEQLEPEFDSANQQLLRLQIPRFGIRTIQFSKARKR